MNKKIFYLCPQEEGKQEFVCWGFDQVAMTEAVRENIKRIVLSSLEEIQQLNDKCYSDRSFSVLFGHDKANFWVAIPRQLSTKVMNIFNTQLKSLNMDMKRIITSYNNSFDYSCPFYPVISYDRGFIYDATALEAKTAYVEHLQVVNG